MITDWQRRWLQVIDMTQRMIAETRKTDRGTVIGEQPYTYSHTPLAIGAGASASVNIPIDSGSDFDAYYISGNAFTTGTGAAVTNPFATVQLTDTGTGRTLHSVPIYFFLMSGQGGQPFIMQNVWQLKAKSNIQVSYVNNQAAQTTFQITFTGIKKFYK